MVEPSILQYRFQKDQQILKDVVDFFINAFHIFYHDMFRPSSGGHNPHTPIPQNIAWVAYQALTTSWG
jgi:hypothetical protein